MSGRREATLAALVAWLNDRLESTDPIGPDTQLFEGLIDSMAILELIAWTEVATERTIPDEQIVMSSFATPRTIVEVFSDE